MLLLDYLSFNSLIFNIFLNIVLLNITFFVLGNVFFNLFSIEKNNIFYSICSGFIIYFLLIFLFYFPGIFLNLKVSMFENFEIIREFSLSLFIVFYFIFIFKYNYSYNLKNFSFIGFYLLFSFILAIIFIYSKEAIELKSDPIQNNIISNLNEMINNNSLTISAFKPYQSNIENYHSRFQTYYFFALNYSILVNKDLSYFFDKIIPIFLIIFLSSFLFSTLSNSKTSLLNYSISSFLFISFFILFLFIILSNGIIFVYISFLFLLTIFLDKEFYFYLEQKHLYLPIYSFFLFFTSITFSEIVFIIFFISLIFILIEKKQSFIRITNLSIFILFLQFSFLTFFVNFIYFLLFFIPTILFLFFSFYKILSLEDTIKIENFIKTNKNKFYFFSFIFFYLFLIIFLIRGAEDFTKQFLLIFNTMSSFEIVSYVFILNLFPLLFILFILKFNKNKTVINIRKISYFIIPNYLFFLNPITLPFWNMIFPFKLYNFEYVINITTLFIFILEFTLYERRNIFKEKL